MRTVAVLSSLTLLGLTLAGCKYGNMTLADGGRWLPSCTESADSGGPDDNGALYVPNSNITRLTNRSRSYKACQTLTVMIDEETTASEEAKTNVARTTSSKAHVGAMVGLIGELAASNPNWASEAAAAGVSPGFGIEGGSDTGSDAAAGTSRKGIFDGTLTVMVVDVLDNGLLEVEGGRHIMINNEVQILRLHGYVDPRHVQAEDMVWSWRLAEPHIALVGQGVVGDKQIVPWLQRALDRVAPL